MRLIGCKLCELVSNNIPMTLLGFQKIQEEIRRLKNVERRQVVEAIASAREYGDLSENAEYHAAKDRQGMIEARLADLEDKLSRAEVVDTSKIKSDVVQFGATVCVVDEETGVKSTFQIVGSDEADVKLGLIPITSPIARALIGRKKDEVIEVNVPSGMKVYNILDIKYI